MNRENGPSITVLKRLESVHGVLLDVLVRFLFVNT